MPSLQPILVSLLLGTAATPLVGLVGAEAQTIPSPFIRVLQSAFWMNTGRNTFLAQKTGLDTYGIGSKRLRLPVLTVRLRHLRKNPKKLISTTTTAARGA